MRCQKASSVGCAIQSAHTSLRAQCSESGTAATGKSRIQRAMSIPEMSWLTWPLTRQLQATIETANVMFQYGTLRHGSGGDTVGTIAARCGGRATAAYHCTLPPYEAPIIPTRPVEPGSDAAHST